MYIETSFPRSQGDNAILVSPTYNNTLQICSFTFWYHMYGSTTGVLNIWLMRAGTNRTLLWTRSGNQGNLWRSASVQLGRFTGDFQVKFPCIFFTTSYGFMFLYFSDFHSNLLSLIFPRLYRSPPDTSVTKTCSFCNYHYVLIY